MEEINSHVNSTCQILQENVQPNIFNIISERSDTFEANKENDHDTFEANKENFRCKSVVS